MGSSKDRLKKGIKLARGYEGGMMNISFYMAESESPATLPGDMSREVRNGEVEVKAGDSVEHRGGS